MSCFDGIWPLGAWNIFHSLSTDEPVLYKPRYRAPTSRILFRFPLHMTTPYFLRVEVDFVGIFSSLCECYWRMLLVVTNIRIIFRNRLACVSGCGGLMSLTCASSHLCCGLRLKPSYSTLTPVFTTQRTASELGETVVNTCSRISVFFLCVCAASFHIFVCLYVSGCFSLCFGFQVSIGWWRTDERDVLPVAILVFTYVHVHGNTWAS